MGKGRRRQFSEEFREEAVRLARESDRSVRAIAAELGISVTCLRNWLTATPSEKQTTTKGRVLSLEEEVRQLKRDNERLREEREILKKSDGLLRQGRTMRFAFIQAISALRMALTHRGARGGLHHSDRGVQYASAAYQRLLKEAGFKVSMSRIGGCWDNAVVESFFATLTKELLIDGLFENRHQASRELFQFIEIWYNRRRRHSSLGYRTPAEFEASLARAS